MNPSNDKQSYTVSVVIPAYNVEKYIGRAIDSVLAQTRRPDEIIVVDDGSTDNTAEVIRSYGSKVHCIRQENGGASVARNTGIEEAKSEWIAFLDADDEWLPDKLSMQIECLAKNQGLLWCGGNYLIRDAGDSSCREACVEREVWRSFAGDKDYMENYFDALLRDICILTSTVVVARNFLKEVGMFRLGQMWAQDTDLFWRMAYRQPKLGYLIQPIAVYSRDLPTSITMLNKGRIQQRCDLVERHLKMAAEHGMSESFRPCALKLLTRWLRGYLDQPNVEILQILDRFDDILPRNLKIETRMRIASPRLAGCLFKCYFAAKKLILPGKGKK